MCLRASVPSSAERSGTGQNIPSTSNVAADKTAARRRQGRMVFLLRVINIRYPDAANRPDGYRTSFIRGSPFNTISFC
ncbi:hypothetical protein KCP74_21660 [Salmonella enterica subsp. enterica]|nr:hypothetical protein KCP74_21660 [Salmonella enterica subsp. enterica]